MKHITAAMTIILSGCASGPMPWVQGPQVSESECTTQCNAHFTQCPQVFANFPERGAVECPAAHEQCLKRCELRHDMSGVAPRAAVPLVPSTPAPTPLPTSAPSTASTAPILVAPAVASRAASSKEARLRELKHLYDEGLISDDVYKERQRAILSEP